MFLPLEKHSVKAQYRMEKKKKSPVKNRVVKNTKNPEKNYAALAKLKLAQTLDNSSRIRIQIRHCIKSCLQLP